jgi:hypothetical protein
MAISPPDPPRRPVPRPFLERVSRPLLARLLAPYGEHLAAHLPVDALATSAQTDRVHVETLWHVLGAPPPVLVPLRDDLLIVADVATPAGHEALLAHDSARVLDHELGAEDCAAIARLEHKALFDAARPQAAGQSQTKSFASFQSSSPRPLPDDPACRVAFQQRMSEELLARGRTSYFKVHAWRSSVERHMELVYGRLAAARDLLGKAEAGAAHDITAQVTDRTTERAHAIFHDDTWVLDIAGPEWMKELTRRIFGEAYFGAATHFHGDETITLAPFADLAASLACHDIPGLRKVELQTLSVDLGGDDAAWIAVGARGDCLKSAAAAYVLRALDDGAPAEATLHVFLTNKTRPLKLKLVPPRRMEFDRRDPRVVQIVRDWLVARGFMRNPEHLRQPDAALERESS